LGGSQDFEVIAGNLRKSIIWGRLTRYERRVEPESASMKKSDIDGRRYEEKKKIAKSTIDSQS